MFKLADHPGGGDGLYCGSEGLFLGSSPLIVRSEGAYRLRAQSEITALLAAAYGSVDQATGLLSRLGLIREALQKSDLCNAMILAVHSRLGSVSADGLARLDRIEKLSKHNFNPDEPRDRHGRWTDSEGAYAPRLGPSRHNPCSSRCRKSCRRCKTYCRSAPVPHSSSKSRRPEPIRRSRRR